VLFGRELSATGNAAYNSASLLDLNPGSANDAENIIIGGAYA
jgi:hypothetical protein